MKESIKTILNEALAVKKAVAEDATMIASIERIANLLASVRDNGGTIYACGNGGSACDAMHLTEELVARYKRDRPGIRAMHLLDPSVLTCWSNDKEFAGAFARQIETFCGPKDCAMLFTTSGNSLNILRAAEAARKLGTPVVGFVGRDGGKLPPLCDHVVHVHANGSERIQEVHITVIHLLCELLETDLARKSA